ncbi:MAG TPA: AMP-binding protein, partial [Thermoanaerobaculia bacterium]
MYRKQARDLVEILHWRGEHQHGRSALTFCADDGTETTWTYGELDLRARSFAVALRELASAGDRAVLLCPGGLHYVRAIVGCFYAGVVAVPAYPPANARQLARIDAILRDSGTDLIVTTTETRDRINKWLAAERRQAQFRFVCVDEIPVADADRWSMPLLTPETLAFLQYTSGSTSDPKGVMVGHGNLMANLAMIEQGFALTPDSEWGTWLPMFHDMGLIGNVLEPLYLGAKTVLMSPQAFVREPVSWLQLMTRHRSSVTGAPNFGYALCARGVSDEQKQGLDLSALTVAYCGSEPIDPQVLERFAEAFRDCGFRKEALFPCYGMAEATLFATGSVPGGGARSLRVDARALESDIATPVDATAPARVLTASGHPAPGQQLRIVDPETRRPLPEGRVGEVWLKGPNIAQGYWGAESLTRETFGAMLVEGDGPYLRTGDLAFVDGGSLYVTGRSKDLIIIRGRNVYPQDVERTAAESSAAVLPGGTAAFSIEIDGTEELVVVQEIRRAARHESPEAIAAAIRNAVVADYELAPYAIVLLKPATLPKTSSGKVRRAATREAYLNDALDVHFAWTRPSAATADAEGSTARADEVIAWFRHYAATRIDSRLIDERRTIPPYVVLDFGNRGLLGLQAPLAFGGLALTYRDMFRVLAQIAAFDVTLGSLVGVHNALGLRPLLRFGSERQKQALLPNLASGRELASFAYTEPAAGSNAGAIEATATPDGRGGWLLRGSKKWIGSASWSGCMHVFAHLLDDDGRRRGITGFVVRQGAAGLVQGAEELTMGSRGMVQNAIELHDVRVGPEDLLGEPGEGAIVAQDVMEHGRICIAVSAAGVLKRAAQLMTRYARRRSIATGRLLDNAVTRERLTQIITEAAALDAFIDAFAEWLDA